LGDLITLDALSERFFISKYHLCHVFKSATGLSVMDYVINCRILKAQELLRQGMRVQPVGERTGFRNTAHFIRTFRTLTGLSPKRYAKKYLELTG
jgi:AraC-like DNA-binding protein